MAGDFQRARKPAEKAQRREQILQTARRWLDETLDSSGLSLNGLARAAGMAKSNVYRYFQSREAVLLEVLATEWIAWHDRLLAALEQEPRPLTAERLAELLARSVAERPTLAHLTSVLPSVLEHNVDPQTVASFKEAGVGLFTSAAEAMHEACPRHPVAAHLELLHHAFALVVGSWPLSNPCPEIAAVMDRPSLAMMRREFEPDMVRVLTLLLRGLAAEADEAAG